jgi:hypothetical protein
MPQKMNLAAIEERIATLESAYSSLRAQVMPADAPGQRQRWLEALDSILEELNELKPLKLAKDSLLAQQQAQAQGHGAKIQQILDLIENAERAVFKAFVLATTCIGAASLISHEIAALEHPVVIEEQVPKNQKLMDPPKTMLPGKERGAEPIPEPLQKQREKLGREFARVNSWDTARPEEVYIMLDTARPEERIKTLEELFPRLYEFQVVMPAIPHDWLRFIGAPDSVHSPDQNVLIQSHKSLDVPPKVSIVRPQMKKS